MKQCLSCGKKIGNRTKNHTPSGLAPGRRRFKHTSPVVWCSGLVVETERLMSKKEQARILKTVKRLSDTPNPVHERLR